MTLGERIQTERKKLGMSQESLADKLGVSRQAVSKWELCDSVPDLDKLLAMAEVFGCTTDTLLGRGEKEEPKGEPRGSACDDPGADVPGGPQEQSGYRYGYGGEGANGGEDAAEPRTGGRDGWRDGLNAALDLARRKGYIVGYLMMFWGGLEAVGTSLIAAIWGAATGGMKQAANGIMGGFPGGMGGWETSVEIDGVMVPFSQLDKGLQQALGGAGISGGMPGGMDQFEAGFNTTLNVVSSGPVIILVLLALIGLAVAIAGGIIVYRGKRRDK